MSAPVAILDGRVIPDDGFSLTADVVEDLGRVA